LKKEKQVAKTKGLAEVGKEKKGGLQSKNGKMNCSAVENPPSRCQGRSLKRLKHVPPVSYQRARQDYNIHGADWRALTSGVRMREGKSKREAPPIGRLY